MEKEARRIHKTISGDRLSEGNPITVIMDARPLFTKIKAQVKDEVKALGELGYTPGLSAILASDDPRDLGISEFYVAKKKEDCKDVGIYSESHDIFHVSREKREGQLIDLINTLNDRDDVSGILVQQPLQDFIDKSKILSKIEPSKDVDGLTPFNQGKLHTSYSLEEDLLPCTAVGVMDLLEYYGVEFRGKFAVIVGRSDLVGKPLRNLLENKRSTVLACDRTTPNDLKYKMISLADLVICAAGRPPEMYGEDSFRLSGDMIKDDVVVVNIGMRRDESKRFFFDVDFDSVKEKASYVTPNLNGTGLMTRGVLLKNVIKAAKVQARKIRAD